MRQPDDLAGIIEPMKRDSRTLFRLALLLLAAASSGGCPTTPPPAPRTTGFTGIPRDNANGDSPPSLDTGPCVARLDVIREQMLLYFATNRRLPPTLEALRAMPSADVELTLSCPDSGKLYVYFPAGLRAPGQRKRMIVYDPVPAANGKRGCILLTDAYGDQPMTLEALELPEAVFKVYQDTPF